MTYLPQDLFSRRGEPSQSASRLGGAIPIALLFVALVLLVLSRIDHGLVRELRVRSLDRLASPLGAVAAPLESIRHKARQWGSFFDLGNEVERLRDENRRLKASEWRAVELERKLAQLSALGQAVAEPGLPSSTASVIAAGNGPFSRSLFINTGRQQGVKPGYSVVSEDGLIGRVVEAGTKASRVLLLTDATSRVPVTIGPNRARAILAGDNSDMPKLEHSTPDRSILVGDDVFTSGDDGLIPRGLRIGVVAGGEGNLRVRLSARIGDAEYVGVLHFDTPSLDLEGGGPPPVAEMKPGASILKRPLPAKVR